MAHVWVHLSSLDPDFEQTGICDRRKYRHMEIKKP